MVVPDYRSFKHSAEGSSWKKHKYVKKVGDTYYYPDTYEGGRHIPNKNKEPNKDTAKQNIPKSTKLKRRKNILNRTMIKDVNKTSISDLDNSNKIRSAKSIKNQQWFEKHRRNISITMEKLKKYITDPKILDVEITSKSISSLNLPDSILDSSIVDTREFKKSKFDRNLETIKHSAEGSSWEKHKYIKKVDGTYYYPDSYKDGRHLPDNEKSDLSETDVENLAKEVIRGNFGNGQERKDLLGKNYESIQQRVNEILSNPAGSKKLPNDKTESSVYVNIAEEAAKRAVALVKAHRKK